MLKKKNHFMKTRMYRPEIPKSICTTSNKTFPLSFEQKNKTTTFRLHCSKMQIKACKFGTRRQPRGGPARYFNMYLIMSLNLILYLIFGVKNSSSNFYFWTKMFGPVSWYYWGVGYSDGLIFDLRDFNGDRANNVKVL